MARYIDADKVAKTVNDFAKDLGVFGKSAVKMCVDVIENAPKQYWICSRCKKEAYWDADGEQQLFDFCPNCGANMIGGTK